VNAGGDDVSLFAVSDDGLALLDRVASGGTMPTSIAVRDSQAYVLNASGDAKAADSVRSATSTACPPRRQDWPPSDTIAA
jgi:hypothetical protein